MYHQKRDFIQLAEDPTEPLLAINDDATVRHKSIFAAFQNAIYESKRLKAASVIIASGASTCFGRVLAALHDSRRKQAAVERARYRHLIPDPDTGACFGANPTAQADEPLRF